MSFILFDTLKLSRTLRDKGHFTTEQAEALAEALNGASRENLATKIDTSVSKDELKNHIAELRAEIKAYILKWVLLGVTGISTVLICGSILAAVLYLKS